LRLTRLAYYSSCSLAAAVWILMQKYIYFAEEGIGGIFNVLQTDHIDRMNVRSLQSQGKFWH
jgi:hypothetical protein